MSALPARQALPAGELPRHRHAAGYAALVLAGGYEEAGDNGRRRVRAGAVVVHDAWDAHLNRIPAAGAEVLNLPLPDGGLASFGTVDDPDAIVRACERDPREAVLALAEQFRPAPADSADWPDALAAALAGTEAFLLGVWARGLGLSPEHLSRRFRALYGVAPQRFRWEARSRAAWRDVVRTDAPLAEIALARGFADQAHMTRSVRALTGATPGAWRASNPFKTPARALATLAR